MPSAMSLAFENVLARCREVLPLADAMEQTPAQVAELRAQLSRTVADANQLREVFASERASWQIEWRSLKDRSDHDYLDRRQELEGLAEWEEQTRAELRELQDKIGAERKNFEKLVGECRRLERMML